LDISLVHSPSLEAMLYREAQSIMKIAKVLGKNEEKPCWYWHKPKLSKHRSSQAGM